MNFLERKLHRAPYKVLQKLGLSRFLTYRTKIRIGSSELHVPVVGNETGPLLYVSKGFKTAALEFLSTRANTKIFFDVGANMGQTFLEACAFDREIRYFGFEPNPTAFRILAEVVRLNGTRARLFPWACSTEARPAKFFAYTSTDPGATIAPQIRPGLYDAVEEKWVAAYPIDLIAPMLDLDRSFVMKIDVEGAELDVLEGASQTIGKHRPAILCEVLHAHSSKEIGQNNDHKAQLEALLSSLDYTLYALGGDGRPGDSLASPRRIDSFPRDVLWEDAPNTCDFLFLPREMVG